jgi:hypothetical protein
MLLIHLLVYEGNLRSQMHLKTWPGAQRGIDIVVGCVASHIVSAISVTCIIPRSLWAIPFPFRLVMGCNLLDLLPNSDTIYVMLTEFPITKKKKNIRTHKNML